MSDPRLHHYVFGHIAMRQIFFHNSPAFVAALLDRGDDVLRRIWDDVGAKIEEGKEGDRRLSSAGLTCTHREIAPGIVAVIVSLPPPEEMPEAHYVGLILRPPRKRLWGLVCTHKGIARYVTLEHGMNLDGTPRTVLCEWEGESHLNMGDGPEASEEAFAAKLREMVRK